MGVRAPATITTSVGNIIPPLSLGSSANNHDSHRKAALPQLESIADEGLLLYFQVSTVDCQLSCHCLGVSSATIVSPPRRRASSTETSARLIRSVTISSHS